MNGELSRRAFWRLAGIAVDDIRAPSGFEQIVEPSLLGERSLAYVPGGADGAVVKILAGASRQTFD
jgi:hypothetical protein